MLENLRWKKYNVLNDGYICLVDVMGNDSSIVQAARVSYGKEETITTHRLWDDNDDWNIIPKSIQDSNGKVTLGLCKLCNRGESELELDNGVCPTRISKDRSLIRRLMMDSHTSPFEMVEFKFKIRVPMDCWRQWIRHRTANVNEYSTRYSEAIDSQQTTLPGEWRLQAKDNKQGSSGYLEEWPERFDKKFSEYGASSDIWTYGTPGEALSSQEEEFHEKGRELYDRRLHLGIAREQARKDLPLSTYTEAYWKCDLHNIFNFLRLRMDSHAQLEIRLYANAMYEIVKQVCPIACEAFEDYVLQAKKFSAIEMELLRHIVSHYKDHMEGTEIYNLGGKPLTMTDNEWKSFLSKIS